MATPSLEIAPQIGGPDRLQPTQIQSDTYAGYERPAVDHNLERLASSLGHFNSGLRQYTAAAQQDKLVRDKEAEAELKKAQQEESLNRYYKYLGNVTDDQLRTDIQTGKVDFSADPIVGDMWRKQAAHSMMGAVAKQLDEDTKAGKIPLEDKNFNAAQYVINQVAEARKKFGAFDDRHFNGEVVERLRPLVKAVKDMQDDKIGRAYKEKSEATAFDNMTEAMRSGLERGASGVELSERIRSVHRDIGPIIGGGDYGVSLDRLDEIQLKVLEEAARKDGKVAEAVISVLAAPRKGLDNSDLPSLEKTYKHREAVSRIHAIAFETKNREYRENVARQAAAFDLDAIKRMDGSVAGINDASVKDMKGSEIPHLSKKERIETAVAAALQEIRQANGGNFDVPKEIEITSRNNVKHPIFFGMLENYAAGLGGATTSPSAIGPDQIEALTKGTELYEKMTAQNDGWVKANLSPEARATYEKFLFMTREMRMSPQAAAGNIAAWNAGKKEPVSFTGAERESISNAARGMDTGDGYVFATSPVNIESVEKRITETAAIYMQIGKMDTATAIQKAAESVKKNAVVVNGSLLSSGSLSKDDAPFASKALDKVFSDNAAVLKEAGITKGSDLTIVPYGQGTFMVVKHSGGFLPAVPVYDPKDKTKVVAIAPLRLTMKDIRGVRAEDEKAATQALVDKAKRKSGLIRSDGKELSKVPDAPASFGNPMEMGLGLGALDP